MSNPSLSDIRGKSLFLGYPSGHRAQQEVRTLSIVAPSLRRRWLPVAAGVASLALFAVFLVVSQQEAAVPATQPASPAEAVPQLPQAEWVVRSYPSGIRGKPNRAIRRRVDKTAMAIASTLDELYAATFLEPDRLRAATHNHMAPRAARRFRNADITVAGAQDVQFKRRQTRIGVEGKNARRAVATARLVVAGRLAEERFRLRHESTLWLERSEGSWRVIAFDIAQRPRR